MSTHCFTLGVGGDLAAYEPPCRRCRLPDGRAVYVHAYSGAEAARWLKLARLMAGGEPDREHLVAAQVISVCRVSPGGPLTFKLPLQEAPIGFVQLQQGLPGPWLERVCIESDLLCLDGFVPSTEADETASAAAQRLGELLADPELWAAMSLLSLKLYGVPLARNGEPLGELLTHLQRELDLRLGLAEALGALAALGESAND